MSSKQHYLSKNQITQKKKKKSILLIYDLLLNTTKQANMHVKLLKKKTLQLPRAFGKHQMPFYFTFSKKNYF